MYVLEHVRGACGGVFLKYRFTFACVGGARLTISIAPQDEVDKQQQMERLMREKKKIETEYDRLKVSTLQLAWMRESVLKSLHETWLVAGGRRLASFCC